LSTYLKRRKEISKYDIDGIIVSDINNHSRNMSGNPEYSFAFKENNVFKDAIVEEVEWNISKDGFLKPRVRIVPIQLSGVQITYVTAHNAKYVYDNKIGKGSIIQITRSGDVIPYIVKIIKPSSEVQMPQILDEWQWNKSGVDIVLKSNSMNDEQLIKTLSYFVKKLDIKNIDEATFKTLVEHKIINSLSDIFRVSEFKDKLLLLDGFKEKKTLKIIKELDDGFNRMSLTDLMVASNIFGHGIGEKKINKIVSTYPNILDLAMKKSYKELYDLIIKIDGFEDITTKQFLEHLETFNDFLKNKVPKNIYNRLKKDIKEIIEKNKDSKDSLKSDKKLLGLKFVMTGFRNKTWETIIIENGGEITSTVSKNTFMLICNSLDESSNKIIKAKEHGIKILEKDAFITYMNSTYSLLFN
jgi:NAD-dependent DNA ligase